MTTLRTLSRSTGIAMLAAGTVLLAAAGCAGAKGGGGGGHMGGGGSYGDRQGHSGNEGFQNPIRNTIHPIITGQSGNKTTIRQGGYAATASQGGHQAVERKGNRDAKLARERRREKHAKPQETGEQAPVRMPSPLGGVPGKSYPISTAKPPAPVATASNGAGTKPAQPGTLPPHDPVGTTRPDPNSNGTATVSNGVIKANLPNGDGGLLVTSKTPGTITVSNGTNSVTLPGGSVVLSGAISVGAGSGLQMVRQPNGDVTVAANPPPTPAPSPASPLPNNGQVDLERGVLGGSILKGIDDFGYGLAHGFAPGPAPPERTSTTTQQ